MNAAYFCEPGGPEVLRYGELPTPQTRNGEVLVRVEVAGLNYADIYRRRGEYAVVPPAPYILGYEGAGIVERLGPGATRFRVGERVVFPDVPRANARYVAAPEEKLIALPDAISFADAATLALQGLTAHFLTETSHRLRAGETILVHAGAGGVGGLIVSIARLKGAHAIALVSNEEKAREAMRLGATATVGIGDDWRGLGVDVVYDSTGSTLGKSLDAARVGGKVVFYGWAGGAPPPIDPRRLLDESKAVVGGDLWNHLHGADRERRARELFAWAAAGDIRPRVAATYPLDRVADAHRLLEGRRALGKVLLEP